MRFPSQPGLIAGLSLQVTSLERSTQLWRSILRLKRASYLAVVSVINLGMG
ncbi:hypothetical protein ABZT49_15785 [Methylobacterium sp. EM32]|uniref:hypothetical protein n=1 Tax=Methylobacterium sp. EM32 TaxID=3163481 RepID=UPI00339EAF00